MYGSIVYVRNDIQNYKVLNCTIQETVESIVIEVSGVTITTVYNPPLPTVKHCGVYVRDFNSHHTSWGYSSNDENGGILSEWIENIGLPSGIRR